MIEDGFAIIDEKDWKVEPGMMAGALELIKPDTSRPGYWLCKCHKCERIDLDSKRIANS